MLENGTFTLNISIPATVYVPTSAKDEVTEGSTSAGQATEVTFLHQEEVGVVFEVEAGAYEFRCKEGGHR